MSTWISSTIHRLHLQRSSVFTSLLKRNVRAMAEERPLKNSFDQQRRIINLCNDLQKEFRRLKLKDAADARDFRFHMNAIQNIICATIVEDQYGRIKA